MATSKQQWRRDSHLLLLAAAVALFLIVAGGVDAHGHETCPTGYEDCDGKSYNKCETNVYTDPYNCNHCHNVCKTYPHAVTKCENGKCTWKCNKLYGDCDGKIKNGCETYLGSDKNCGYCGNHCKVHSDYKYGEAYCSGGQCKSRCPHGWKYNSYKKYCYKKH